MIGGLGPNALPSLEHDLRGHTLAGRPQTGKYPMNPMIITPGSLHSGLVPHGMLNHQMQANSKKSFRIRGREEQQELLKQRQSMGSSRETMEFGNDVLKSVYELRQSHAAFVNRPMSSQPYVNRRHIQSAAPRKTQHMAFGGYILPHEEISEEDQGRPSIYEHIESRVATKKYQTNDVVAKASKPKGKGASQSRKPPKPGDTHSNLLSVSPNHTSGLVNLHVNLNP